MVGVRYCGAVRHGFLHVALSLSATYGKEAPTAARMSPLRLDVDVHEEVLIMFASQQLLALV